MKLYFKRIGSAGRILEECPQKRPMNTGSYHNARKNDTDAGKDTESQHNGREFYKNFQGDA